MNKTWVFITLENSEIKRVSAYGSIRAIYKTEEIKINGKILTEYMVRRLLTDKKYVDSNYYILEKKIKRSKHKK